MVLGKRCRKATAPNTKRSRGLPLLKEMLPKEGFVTTVHPVARGYRDETPVFAGGGPRVICILDVIYGI